MADISELDFASLAQQLNDFFDAQKNEITNLKKGLDLRTARIKATERDVEEKKKQLDEWDKVLNKKYEEVSRLDNARKMEEGARLEHVEADRKIADAQKQLDEVTVKLKEVEAREKEVVLRELAVSDREKNYRKTIKEETIGAIFKNFTK